MGVIHIEDVDEQVMRSIRLRARMTPQERAAEAARIRQMTKGWSPETDSSTVIREIRDR